MEEELKELENLSVEELQLLSKKHRDIWLKLETIINYKKMLEGEK